MVDRRTILKGLGLALIAPIESFRSFGMECTAKQALRMDQMVEHLLRGGTGNWNTWTRFVRRNEDDYGTKFGLALRIKDDSREICPHEWGQILLWSNWSIEEPDTPPERRRADYIRGCTLCGSAGEEVHTWKQVIGTLHEVDYDDKLTMYKMYRSSVEMLMESVPPHLERYIV